MQHAEDLAVEYGVAELWVQHSDRIARGDGKAARHTVEIALWALKADVRVRTLQDPETFRDLLYAVVTGQRNNEDSKRKGLSSSAGRRRAAARGQYIGYLLDGYKIEVDSDGQGNVSKRMVLDPERQELIALIFRLALRGRTCGQIAKSVNDAGWLTKPAHRNATPRSFTTDKVNDMLKNPRYAALASWNGEIVARGHWPAYLSERQSIKLRQKLRRRRAPKHYRRLETYLLAKLARCGRCGAPLYALTGNPHRDGSFARRYGCASHAKDRGAGQCGAELINADTAEAMLVASIDRLLIASAPISPAQADAQALEQQEERERLRAAAIAGDEQKVEQVLERLFLAMAPEAALIRDAAISQRRARELSEAQRLKAWIEQEASGRTEATRAEARELNGLLRRWFSELTIEVQPHSVLLGARRRGALPGSQPSTVTIDRASWTRFAAPERRLKLRYCGWDDSEIVGALQAWADLHGRSPGWSDWARGASNHPNSLTVRRHFGSWEDALGAGGLAPSPSPAPERRSWDELDLIEALRSFSERHGHVPLSVEWLRAEPEHPSATTVRAHFGSWGAALGAAGLVAEPLPTRRSRPWSDAEILTALAAWANEHGRPPAPVDWLRGAAGRPAAGAVRNHFGTWRKGLAAAGLLTSDAPRHS
jgi:Homing endonuclease associated repeat/Recombinase/Recombinase zinc beta ribbon domain